MSEKCVKWLIRGKAERLDASIREEFNIGPLVERVLVSRGITQREEVAQSLGIGLPTYDPFLMKDMDKAVSRINKAIENKENITVFYKKIFSIIDVFF